MHPIAQKIEQIQVAKGLTDKECGTGAGFKYPRQEWRQLKHLPNRQHFYSLTLIKAAKGLDVPIDVLLSEAPYTQPTKPRAKAG